MLKNILIAFAAVVVIAIGFGYAIYQDPERPTHQLIERAISQLSSKASALDARFLSNQTLPESSDTISMDYLNSRGQTAKLALQVKISRQFITLRFGDGDTPIANQSIILRPTIKAQQVVWQCLDGNVLVRFRPKDCRLGYGILLADYQ